MAQRAKHMGGGIAQQAPHARTTTSQAAQGAPLAVAAAPGNRLSSVFSTGAESRWRSRKRTVRVVHGNAETSLSGRDLPRSVAEQVALAPAELAVSLYVNGAWLPFRFARQPPSDGDASGSGVAVLR